MFGNTSENHRNFNELMSNCCQVYWLEFSHFWPFFCENTAYFKKNRIRFLYSRNFWSVSRVDDVIHRSWHYFGILFPFLAIFKGFGGKNDGLRWYFFGLRLTSFSNTLATLKKVFVASWQHLGFKTYMSWRPESSIPSLQNHIFFIEISLRFLC